MGDDLAAEQKKLDAKVKLKKFSPAIVIEIVGFLVTYQFVDPAPFRDISTGSGSLKGANGCKFSK